jgi:hypothetical protein
MYGDRNVASAPDLTPDEEALLEEMPQLTGIGQSRRGHARFEYATDGSRRHVGE